MYTFGISFSIFSGCLLQHAYMENYFIIFKFINDQLAAYSKNICVENDPIVGSRETIG